MLGKANQDQSGILLQQFDLNAERFANLSAIQGVHGCMSYAQLHSHSLDLAAGLKGLGLSAEETVCVLCDDAWTVIPLMLALFRIGAVFIPLNPGAPQRQTMDVLNNAKPGILIYSMDNAQLLNSIVDGLKRKIKTACVDSLAEARGLDEAEFERREFERQEFERLQFEPIDPDSLAYVVYSSGSTGKPKGIGGTQRGVCHFARWEVESLELHAGCRVSQLSKTYYDAFLRDVFTPLSCGGCICLPPDNETLLDPKRLFQWLISVNIQLLHTIPSVFRKLLDEFDATCFPELNYVLLAGERLLGSDVARWYDQGVAGARLINCYGPTETVMIKTAYFVKPEDAQKSNIPIGKPIAGTKVCLLDASGQEVEPGKIGEVCISPPFQLSGYFKENDHSAQLFVTVANSSETGRVYFRSGDYGCFNTEGMLEFLGRKDQQVKINGVRVEIGEIEHFINQAEAVHEAVVKAVENAGRLALVCYLVSDVSKDKAVDAIKRCLHNSLPSYMWPSYYYTMERLPRLPNGKVNYRRLPEELGDLEQSDSKSFIATLFDEAYDLTQFKLVRIWENVLLRKGIKIDDNYFELGGDSLSVFQVLNAIEAEFKQQISLSQFLENPCIIRLAELLKQGKNPVLASPDPVVVPLSVKDGLRPIWFIHAPGGNVLSYARLATSLSKDYSVYGLQYPYGRKIDDLELLAFHYANQIRSVQLRGPYRLGGWSMGGVVALAVAKALVKAGGEVESVFLLDSEMPYLSETGAVLKTKEVQLRAFASLLRFIAEGFSVQSAQQRHYSDNTLEKILYLIAYQLMGLKLSRADLKCLDSFVFDLADQLLVKVLGEKSGWLNYLPRRSLLLLTPEMQLKLVIRIMNVLKLMPANFDSNNAQAFVNAFRYNVAAVCRYRLSDCNVRLVLIRAEGSASDQNSAQRWRYLNCETVEEYQVQGNHFTFLSEAHVRSLAAVIRDELKGPVHVS